MNAAERAGQQRTGGVTVTSGFVAAGYEPVAEAFRRNFADRGEVGAAFAAYRDGEIIVDLWGGVADTSQGHLWRQDTIQVVMSGTKGLVAVCLLLLIERGELDLDVPVAQYWPEFAHNGKADILVRHLVAHQARLPAIRTHLTERDLTRPELLAELLATQSPDQDPRADFIYHAMTWGWLCGELIRRVSGRTVGTFFADEVATLLELDIWIGLPESEASRLARLEYSQGCKEAIAEQYVMYAGDDLWKGIVTNPEILPPDRIPFNSPTYCSPEIPAGNGIGTARSIARLYACLARGGEFQGVRLLRPETIKRGCAVLASGNDCFAGPRSFGVGFMLQDNQELYGPPEQGFGHPGAGGSIHGAWPAERVGFSYSMNQMRDSRRPDERSRTLLRALHGCVNAVD